MANHEFPLLATSPGNKLDLIRFTGAGAAAPTLTVGHGITVTRTALGVYKLTWSANPGQFVGIIGQVFGDATPSVVKGFDVTHGAFTAGSSTTNANISISLWDASQNAVDLATTSFLSMIIAFAAVL